jgi:hypothetical protein
MDVTQIIHGPLALNSVPLPSPFRVQHAKQALFVAGSIRWDDPPQGRNEDPTPPDSVGVDILLDPQFAGGSITGGRQIGSISLGRCAKGFHAALVPAVFSLSPPLAAGNHTIALQNQNNNGGTVLQSGTCFFSVTLLDFE